jgi:hypothetical protein
VKLEKLERERTEAQAENNDCVASHLLLSSDAQKDDDGNFNKTGARSIPLCF